MKCRNKLIVFFISYLIQFVLTSCSEPTPPSPKPTQRSFSAWIEEKTQISPEEQRELDEFYQNSQKGFEQLGKLIESKVFGTPTPSSRSGLNDILTPTPKPTQTPIVNKDHKTEESASFLVVVTLLLVPLSLMLILILYHQIFIKKDYKLGNPKIIYWFCIIGLYFQILIIFKTGAYIFNEDNTIPII
ncbi:hypothetical protein GF339_08855, partial [candidate division KSB3 bacterium]|nr:hypothetical protein [candidate division KSB3 bacterium]